MNIKKKEFIRKMHEYAETMRPSADRAQCLRMAQIVKEDKSSKTFRELLINDHRSLDGARRAARLVCMAGMAEERRENPKYWGEFKFFDEQTFEVMKWIQAN